MGFFKIGGDHAANRNDAPALSAMMAALVMMTHMSVTVTAPDGVECTSAGAAALSRI